MGQSFTNNATSTLVSPISGNDVTIEVVDASNFPVITSDPDDFGIMTIEDANGVFEIVRCTERNGNIFTVVRAQEGTGVTPDTEGFPFAAGDRFELRLTAGAMEEFLQRTGDIIDGGTY